jgi:excisionase family DNA binding protein
MTKDDGAAELDDLPARPTIPQTARYLGISTKTVRARLADGTLRGYRIGPKLIRIDRESVLSLAAQPI